MESKELTDTFKGAGLVLENPSSQRDLLRVTHLGQSSVLKLADLGSEQRDVCWE